MCIRDRYGSIPSPRYIAALSTWSGFGGDWDKSNCGRCFEIKCDPDGEWGKNCRGDRVQASVVVVVTDKCPCDDRNRRWCCGGEWSVSPESHSGSSEGPPTCR